MLIMFEKLNMKIEFIQSLREYTIMVFETGDLNKIKDLLMRNSLLSVNKKTSTQS